MSETSSTSTGPSRSLILAIIAAVIAGLGLLYTVLSAPAPVVAPVAETAPLTTEVVPSTEPTPAAETVVVPVSEDDPTPAAEITVTAPTATPTATPAK